MEEGGNRCSRSSRFHRSVGGCSASLYTSFTRPPLPPSQSHRPPLPLSGATCSHLQTLAMALSSRAPGGPTSSTTSTAPSDRPDDRASTAIRSSISLASSSANLAKAVDDNFPLTELMSLLGGALKDIWKLDRELRDAEGRVEAERKRADGIEEKWKEERGEWHLEREGLRRMVEEAEKKTREAEERERAATTAADAAAAVLPPPPPPPPSPLLTDEQLATIDAVPTNFATILDAVKSLESELLKRLPKSASKDPMIKRKAAAAAAAPSPTPSSSGVAQNGKVGAADESATASPAPSQSGPSQPSPAPMPPPPPPPQSAAAAPPPATTVAIPPAPPHRLPTPETASPSSLPLLSSSPALCPPLPMVQPVLLRRQRQR